MTGLIAFFDILGYQSFLSNTTAADSVTKVLELITTTPSSVKEGLSNYAYGKATQSDELKQAVKALNHLIFSDTIVLSVEYPPDASQNWKNAAFIHLNGVAGILCGKMFLEGLPMRGAIVEGDFYIKDFCFAGQAIVNAYKLCHSLDFSGLVYDATVKHRPSELFAPSIYKQFFVSYCSPLKNSEEKQLIQANWFGTIKGNALNEALVDIDTFVHRAFWAHGKDCPLSVDTKIRNTVKLVRRLAIALKENK